MRKYTKKQNKHLQELAHKGYEKDLSRCTDKLFDKFQKWKEGEITVWDLNEDIHKYHNEIARGLYKTYTIDDPIFPVVFGIQTGAIDISEINPDCLPEVEKMLQHLNKNTIQ